MAKRKQRLNSFLVEPAITDLHAFIVNRPAADTPGRALRVARIRRRVVLETDRPGDGQSSAGIGPSGEQIRGRPTTLVARVPHFEYRADLTEPRHGDGLSCVENDHRIRVDPGNRLDQSILIPRQAEERTTAAPRKDHGSPAAPGEFDRRREAALPHRWCDPGKAHLNGSAD